MPILSQPERDTEADKEHTFRRTFLKTTAVSAVVMAALSGLHETGHLESSRAPIEAADFLGELTSYAATGVANQTVDIARNADGVIGGAIGGMASVVDAFTGDGGSSAEPQSGGAGGVTIEATDEPTASPTAEPTAEPQTQESCIAAMPLPERIGQQIMIGVQGNELAAVEPFLQEHAIGGVIIMTSPDNPADGSIQHLKASQPIPLLIAADVEGGRPGQGGDGGVNRFHGTLGSLPSAEQAAESQSPEEAQATISAYGAQLSGIGIDAVFGPVVEVAPEGGESPLAPRVFSDDVGTVTEMSQAYVRGWQEAGILPFIKHFPGAMDANTDFEEGVSPPLEDLRRRDFIPFQELVSTGTGVMTGNQIIEGMTEGPASLNREVVTGLLRSELGYTNNLVVTDALNAEAIADPKAAIYQSLHAGNDIALLVAPPSDETMGSVFSQVVPEIEAAVTSGDYPEVELNASVGRILNAKGVTFDAACTPVVQP